VAQLEHRVSQIENFISSLREGRTEVTTTTITTPLHEETGLSWHHGSLASSAEKQSSALITSSAVNQNEHGTHELDNSEDVIDGMAAVQFQDEQDSGFFGKGDNYSHLGAAIELIMPQRINRPIVQYCIHAAYLTRNLSCYIP
jgi:hypothetical protein